jgi:Caspase domain
MLKNLVLVLVTLLVVPRHAEVESHAVARPTVWFLMMSVNSEADDQDEYAEEAEAICEKLKGIEAVYKVEKRILLRKDCNRQNCLNGFEWLKQSRNDDIIMVYIGCHGRDTTRGFVFYTSDNSITGTEIKNHLSGLKGQLALFVDTCHSGAMARDWANCGPNVSIICSCRIEEYAQCWQLSSALIEALNGAADYNNDGFIDLTEIRRYIEKRMPELWGKQHPVLSKSSPELKLAKIC